jgi:hypothetical protein
VNFALLAMLILSSSSRVELVDEVFDIPGDDWRYVEVSLRQEPVRVSCAYEVVSPGGRIRVALMSHSDLQRLRNGEPHGFIAATPGGSTGSMSFLVRAPGKYAVLINNEPPGGAARVHLRVSLDFSGESEPTVRYLSPQRQLTVILIGFAIFFGIVFYSGRKLWRALKG